MLSYLHGCRLREWSCLAILVAAYLVRLVAFHALGITYDAYQLPQMAMHLMPSHLFWESGAFWPNLWMMHSTPPLSNIMAYIIVNRAYADWGTTGLGINAGFGVIGFVSLFYAFRLLRVSVGFAGLFCTLFIMSPTYILYEHTFAVNAVVWGMSLLAMYGLVAFVIRGNAIALTAGWGAWAVAGLAHAAIHLGLPVMIGATLLVSRRVSQRLIVVSMMPLLLLAGLYAKNYSYYGFFGASSWLGFNLSRVLVTDDLTMEEAETLERAGANPSYVMSQGFVGTGDMIFRRFSQFPQGYPVLDDQYRSDGAFNWHNAAVVPAGREALAAFAAAVSVAPRMWWYGINRGVFLSLQQGTEWIGARPNRLILFRYEVFVNSVIMGAGATSLMPLRMLYDQTGTPMPNHLLTFAAANQPYGGALFPWGSLWLLVGHVVLCIVHLWRWPDERAIWFAVLLSSGFLFFVTAAMEFGENSRFASFVTPYMILTYGVAFSRGAEALLRGSLKLFLAGKPLR